MSAKTGITKKSHISNATKRDLVRVAIVAIIAREPGITKLQLQRVFSYGYRLFWEKKEGDFHEPAGKEVRQGEGPLGPFAARSYRGRRKGADVGSPEVRPQQLAERKERKK